jgi:HPt (histidine-containing phosphotransfer) domain-containing protein
VAGGLESDVLTRLRTEGGAALVAALAALLARTAPARLALIAHGVATDDRVTVVRAAHSLRSSAANLGALKLALAAEKLEHLAESTTAWAEPEAAQEAASALQQAWGEVADSVRRLAAAHVEPP